jgi:hypothetical protein
MMKLSLTTMLLSCMLLLFGFTPVKEVKPVNTFKKAAAPPSIIYQVKSGTVGGVTVLLVLEIETTTNTIQNVLAHNGNCLQTYASSWSGGTVSTNGSGLWYLHGSLTAVTTFGTVTISGGILAYDYC